MSTVFFFFSLFQPPKRTAFFPFRFCYVAFFLSSIAGEGKVKQLKIVIATVTIQGSNRAKKKIYKKK